MATPTPSKSGLGNTSNQEHQRTEQANRPWCVSQDAAPAVCVLDAVSLCAQKGCSHHTSSRSLHHNGGHSPQSQNQSFLQKKLETSAASAHRDLVRKGTSVQVVGCNDCPDSSPGEKLSACAKDVHRLMICCMRWPSCREQLKGCAAPEVLSWR